MLWLGTRLLWAQDAPQARLKIIDESVAAQWTSGARMQVELFMQGIGIGSVQVL
jgi:hypothetical protein